MKLHHYIVATLILAIVGMWAFSPVQEMLFGSDSGALSPGTMADDATVGTVAWTNPNNAKVSDNVHTTASGPSSAVSYSHYLKATNFGFAIPAGATIDGILVEIERHYNTVLLSVWDDKIYIVKADGTIGTTNKSTGTIFPTSDAYKSYGSSSDLWGETWDDTKINDVDFGVVLGVKLNANPGGDPPKGSQAMIDHIRITVYYTAAAGGGSQTRVSSVIIFE